MKEDHMREAIGLARHAIESQSGGPFGAVVVLRNEVVGRGWNQVLSTHDCTAHAEMVAIREACQVLDSNWLMDCALYTSCEPCPMCLGAIWWSRLARVYFAVTRQDAARIGFDDHKFHQEMQLPLDQRAIPMLCAGQTLAQESGAIMQAWLESDGQLY